MTTTNLREKFGPSATIFTILLGAILLGSTPSRADVCAASASAIVSRSTGGSCAVALAPNQVFTITYRIANASIVDGGANDGQLVSGELQAGRTIDAVLAQTTPLAGAPELPGVLAFVPVCPVGSTGGTKAAGEECDPLLAQCGTGVCGCESALPGVTCTDGVAANRLTLNVTQAITMGPGQLRTVATVRVRRLAGASPLANCGEFFTHIHSVEDLLVVTDPICESAVTAGADASSDLHAPVCFADTDCGDADCNVCAQLGTNNHCEIANLGSACGTDPNATDCMTPACVDNGSGQGVCLQDQNNLAAGTGCDNNGGAPVSAVECQVPVCDAGGTCANIPDPAQEGGPCADLDANNCYRARCAAGGCNQLAVCDPTEASATCRVTISDTIWTDNNVDGIQGAGEAGIPGVRVDVYTCSGGSPSLFQGFDTTNASGHYSFSMPTCNPSETLAINVSGSFAGVLAGYAESPAFCDANNPGTCGAEVTPAQDSNCTGGVSDCRSIAHGTADPTVDCGYSRCGNGVVDPGEECDGASNEICNNAIDDNGNMLVDCADPECMVPGYQSCDTTCHLAPPCVPILRDPATISWDRFKMHGYFVPTTPADLETGGFRILITNEDGEVYRGELVAGDLRAAGDSQSLKRWAFRDGGARSGDGIRGGISRVRVKQRREADGEMAYPFRIEVYADMSRATRARMTLQLYADDDVAFLSATWQGEPGRWYLTPRQAAAGLRSE